MQTGDTIYIYKNELDEACLQHDMAYGTYKDLEKRTQSDKVLKDKAFEVANNPEYDGYQRGLASMVYRFFGKKSKGTGIKNEINENQQLVNELHNPIIRKFKKRKMYSSFKDNILGADLADMQLIKNTTKELDIFCVLLICQQICFCCSFERQKGITTANAFQKCFRQSKKKTK